MNMEVEKVVLDKAHQNAQYISNDIQKQILHIFATNVRKTICRELGMNKFCILVDESLDESGKEHMAIIEHICKLAQKFYPADFIPHELKALEVELKYFQNDIKRLPCFKEITTLSQLCQQLVETTLGKNYYLINRLVRLVLTFPVSIATTERAFSCMRIIKNRLRSTISDEFLGDCMILHIEREFANAIDNASIIEEFKSSKPRRVRF
ncbi:unnamed protein product [Prunus armeniaca]